MEVTQQDAYDAALMIIGKMTVEQHFHQSLLAEQGAEIERLKGGGEGDSD